MTATESTPARSSRGAESRVIPPMATSGFSVSFRSSATRSTPRTGSGFSFDCVAKTGPMARVIDGLPAGGGELFRRVSGKADHRPRSQKPAGIGGRQVVLPEMNAGSKKKGDIGAVIHNEPRAGLAAQLRKMLRLGVQGPGIVAFMAQLKQPRATLEHSLSHVRQGGAAARGRIRVENGI